MKRRIFLSNQGENERNKNVMKLNDFLYDIIK